MNFQNTHNIDNNLYKTNKENFSELIKSIENDLYNIAKNKVPDKNDIDDVLQETIIKIYDNLDTLKNDEYFKTWAIKILLNECNRVYKQKSKERSLFNKIICKKCYSDEDLSITSLENDLCFKRILEHLSPTEQNIFIFHYQCKYSIKNISNILGINENTIKSKLKRSKKKIKEIYMKGDE